MVEYVLAAWLNTCKITLPDEIFCVALQPGRSFSMLKFVGPGALYNNGKKDRPLEDWCVRNDGTSEAWVHSSFEGDKTVVRLGPGMVPCDQPLPDSVS